MKALLLAGGKGTRLRPLTDNLPKPMVPIMGEPLLKRTIQTLIQHNFDEVVISMCYRPDEINSYFGDGDSMGIKISYIKEDMPLGTGGAIKYAQQYFDSTFMVLNSDIVTDINFNHLIEFHKKSGSIATLTLTSVDNPTQYGVVELENGCIVSFKEKPQPHEITSNLINAGIYVFEPEIFDMIPENKVVSLERKVFPRLLSTGSTIAGYHDSFYWIDIGTPEKYLQVHNDILSGRNSILKKLNNNDIYGNIFHNNQVKLRPTTRIIEPVYIGKNVEIGAKTIIGPNAVICDNVKISSGCRIANSILWDNVIVGKSTNIANAIIGSMCKISNTAEICSSIYVRDMEDPVAI